jgi:hypothetical protein
MVRMDGLSPCTGYLSLSQVYKKAIVYGCVFKMALINLHNVEYTIAFWAFPSGRTVDDYLPASSPSHDYRALYDILTKGSTPRDCIWRTLTGNGQKLFSKYLSVRQLDKVKDKSLQEDPSYFVNRGRDSHPAKTPHAMLILMRNNTADTIPHTLRVRFKLKYYCMFFDKVTDVDLASMPPLADPKRPRTALPSSSTETATRAGF